MINILSSCLPNDWSVTPPLCKSCELHCRDVVVWIGVLLTITTLVIAIIGGSVFLAVFSGITLFVELFSAFYVSRFSELHPLKIQIEHLHLEGSRFHAENDRLEKSVLTLERENEKQQKALKTLEKANLDLQAEIDLVRNERVHLEKIVHDLKSMEEEQTEKLKTTEHLNLALQEEHEHLKEHLTGLKSELDDLRNHTKYHEQHLKNLREVRSQLAEETEKLRQASIDLAKTQMLHTQVAKDLEKLVKRHDVLTGKQETLVKMMEDLRSNLSGDARDLILNLKEIIHTLST